MFAGTLDESLIHQEESKIQSELMSHKLQSVECSEPVTVSSSPIRKRVVSTSEQHFETFSGDVTSSNTHYPSENDTITTSVDRKIGKFSKPLQAVPLEANVDRITYLQIDGEAYKIKNISAIDINWGGRVFFIRGA